MKIIGENTDLWAQGYFVYDSKKSGSVTVSHLRFGPPIRSTYLVEDADFVACHQFGLLERIRSSPASAAPPSCSTARTAPTRCGTGSPARCSSALIDKDIELWVIDAYRVAQGKMGNRINTVMQPCFFQLAGVLPADEAIANIKQSVEQTYGHRGRTIVERNFAAIDRSLAALHRVEVPARSRATGPRRWPSPTPPPTS